MFQLGEKNYIVHFPDPIFPGVGDDCLQFDAIRWPQQLLEQLLHSLEVLHVPVPVVDLIVGVGCFDSCRFDSQAHAILRIT